MPSKLVQGKAAQGKVRIVGGLYKRTPLSVPNVAGLRPTPDRVRETLFNWLAGFVEGSRCLDLFAGTGALGFEAASRGAKEVVLVESSRQAVEQMIDTLKRLKQPDNITLKLTTAETFLAQQVSHSGAKFDLIFLDPPFGKGMLPKLWPMLTSILADNGKVYVEAEEPIDALLQTLDATTLWQVERAGIAGQVYYHLLSLQ